MVSDFGAAHPYLFQMLVPPPGTKAIDSKKSRALSQAEYEERQKKKLGIQKFNDMRARQD